MDRLRDRPGFVRFWSASTASTFGSYVTVVALGVLVVQTLDAGATGVGLVNAARWLPYLLLGLVVGVLVERSRRLPVLVGTDLARALLLVSVPLLALADRLGLVVLIVLMAVFGLMSLLNDAASQSFLPRLVPGPLLTRANARLDQSDAVAQTAGPALGGGLVSLLTAPWALLVDAASFAVSAVLTSRIRLTEPPSRRLSLRGVLPEARDGLRWVYRHRTLGPSALTSHAWFLCHSAAGAVLTPFVLQTLGQDAFRLGLALAVGGVGALLGSLVAVGLGVRLGAGWVVIASMAGNGVSWAVVAASAGPWSGWLVLALGQLLLGFSMGTSNANEMGYWQDAIPDHLQGRAHATRRSINRAMIVLGAPLGGVLGDALGYRPVLAAAAVGLVLVAVALALTPFRTARLDPS